MLEESGCGGVKTGASCGWSAPGLSLPCLSGWPVQNRITRVIDAPLPGLLGAVMAGPVVPAIRVLLAERSKQDADARDKHGHDAGVDFNSSELM
jgi:hypothetical protein